MSTMVLVDNSSILNPCFQPKLPWSTPSPGRSRESFASEAKDKVSCTGDSKDNVARFGPPIKAQGSRECHKNGGFWDVEISHKQRDSKRLKKFFYSWGFFFNDNFSRLLILIVKHHGGSQNSWGIKLGLGFLEDIQILGKQACTT